MWSLVYLWVQAGLFVNVLVQANVQKVSLQNPLICGPKPPKTAKRLSCEDFHKENMNIARCPYAFPVYIRGRLEDIYSADDINFVTLRTSLDISWNATLHGSYLNHSLTMNSSESFADDPTGAVKDDEHVWIPQLFIPSSQPVHSDQKLIEGDYVRVNGTGRHSVHQTLSTQLWCKTSLRSYPLDTHICTWYLGAFQAQNYSVQLLWDVGAFAVVNKHLTSGFDVSVAYRHQSTARYASLGYIEVSQLSVVIKISRKRWHAVVLVFLPGLLMVIIAWISFYLPDELAEGRVLVSFLNLVGTVQLLRQLQTVPHAGVVRAIDVWMLSVLTFVWLSVVACFLDLKYAFRGLEREQQESVDDVLFFYRQPKLARQLADKSHREERQRAVQRRGAITTDTADTADTAETEESAEPRRFSLAPRRFTLAPRRFSQARRSTSPAPRPGFDMERRRRQSTWDGEDLFWDAEAANSPAAERVEWSEFYQWAHERHAARRRPTEEELEDEDEDGSQWSVQSLLKSMWNIRKEYRWLTWSDYVKKCVEVMYPVFFCVFCVTFWLVYVQDSHSDETVFPAAVEARQLGT